MRANELLIEMPFVSDLKREVATGKKYYHGSSDDLPVGTILTSGNDDYDDNWGDNLWYKALEMYRPAQYRSHSTSVFMVDNDDDIDNAGGGTEYVFTVVPNGPVQRHDMNWMSEIGSKLDDGADMNSDGIKQMVLNYWKGVPHPSESVWEYLTADATIVATEPY